MPLRWPWSAHSPHDVGPDRPGLAAPANLQHGIRRDAQFYILDRHHDDRGFLPEIGEAEQSWFSAQFPNEHLKATPVPLPDGLKGWRRVDQEIDLDAFARYVPNWTVAPSSWDAIPDIMLGAPAVIVSERFRAEIEAIDPGCGTYLAADITCRETGERPPVAYYNWLPRRRVSFKAPDGWTCPSAPRPGVYLKALDIDWALASDEAARACLSTFPVWVKGPGSPVFSRETFQRLKSAGITGLIEAEGERVKLWETVAHA